MAENNLFDLMKTYLDNGEDSFEGSNDYNYGRLFSNPLIQTSLSRFSLIKKIIIRKENLTLIHYFDKFKNRTTGDDRIMLRGNSNTRDTSFKDKDKDKGIGKDNDYPSSSGIISKNGLIQDNSHLLTNKRIIQAYCNDNDTDKEDSQLSQSGNSLDEHCNDEVKVAVGNTNTDTHTDSNNDSTMPRPRYLLTLTIKNLLNNKIKNTYTSFMSNLSIYNKAKKLTNSNLSLIYIFTELAIAKMKTKKDNDGSKEFPNLKLKLQEHERKLIKYESCLNEKMEIIASKNDKIEMLNDHIEDLNSKLKKLETKQKNFNIIEESLCAKCGNSLEESMTQDYQIHNDNISELKAIVQEQLDYISRMEKENKELKHKNNESKERNEAIMSELEIIKNEFNNFTLTYKLKKEISFKEISTQTEAEGKQTALKKKTSATKNQTTSKKFATKLNLTNRSNTSSTNNSVTNYNIINISNEDTLQNLKFDNSILTQEVVSLNKELNKFKTEAKLQGETMKKCEKEKGELNTKLLNKTEGFNKLKKENEELMILIQTSNYKSFVQSELENKKLLKDNSQLTNQVDLLKASLSKKEKTLHEVQTECEKFKKETEGITKFKTERENLVLENSKLESELRRMRYDLDESRNLLERQNILLKNKEEQLSKLNEELSYMTFNSKKAKQEAERSYQDALAYQQILRKMEKDLAEAQLKKDKAENDLQAFKNFISKKA